MSTAAYQQPIIYFFFSNELVDFVVSRIAEHQNLNKYYLLIAAAAMGKYIGLSYEGEDRKKGQIRAIKRGFKAVNEGRAFNTIKSWDRRQFVIASELRQDGEEQHLFYTSVPLGHEIPSDVCHNAENKANDWFSMGRDHWRSLGMQFRNSYCNNRATNAPTLQFFEFLAAEGTNGGAE